MEAVVVFESLWGNTAAVARAIAAGLGDGVQALRTDQITPTAASGAALIVVGAPVHYMSIPTKRTLITAATRPRDGQTGEPETYHLLIRDWLAEMPRSQARAAAFDTRYGDLRGHGGASLILRQLKAKGCSTAAGSRGFVVTRGPGRDRPLHLAAGELDKARAWGAALAAARED